jgi:hypothetical protein
MSSNPRTLIGTWTLHRRLADRRSGQHGTVHGTLEITPELRWLEQGELSWDGALLPVTRELLIVADGGGWQVCFSDGRPFHPWRPGELVEHPCRADLYRGVVDVRGDRLRVLWDVSGPRKNQRIVTRCYRS